jgi:CelD/BcsL family acetyltransferase involved in cellulose biosynthesis
MNRFDFSIIHASNGIPADIHNSWRNLQASNPTLASPFFSPVFTDIVARAHGNVEIGVWKEGDAVVALFPFERKQGNFAGPVGRHISDYDGLIARPDFRRDPQQVLRDCGLAAWDFQHSLASDPIFGPFHKAKSYVALTDISCGYEEYIKKHRTTDHRQLKNYFKRMQKFAEEVGPFNYVMHTGDESVLHKLVALKSAQCQRNGWRDVFAESWTAEVLRSIHQTQTPEFAGMLSALYAGSHLVALHFGMRSTKVLHRWFPVHEESFARFSPGIVLNLKMLEQCGRTGIETIDWGAGEHQLKQFVMDSSIPIGSGSFEVPCVATLARRFKRIPAQARQRIGNSRFGGVARRVRDWVQSR